MVGILVVRPCARGAVDITVMKKVNFRHSWSMFDEASKMVWIQKQQDLAMEGTEHNIEMQPMSMSFSNVAVSIQDSDAQMKGYQACAAPTLAVVLAECY